MIIEKAVDETMFDDDLYSRRPESLTASCPGLIHVVREGDTLYRLSKQYHVGVSDIMYENPYVNLYNLQAGDELCIPVALSPGKNVDEGMPAEKND